MSRPITWQTLMAPDSLAPLRTLESAERSFGNVFQGIGDALKSSEAAQAANSAAKVKGNTQAVLDKIFAIGNADQFQKMQQSGELEKLAAANGNAIDKAAVRSAIDGRLATLQDRDKTGWAFANAQLDQQEAPKTYEVKALLAKGDPASLAQAKAVTAGLSARGQANMLGLLDAREQELVQRTRGEKEWGWKEEDQAQKVKMRPLEIQAKKASIAASNASTASSMESVRNSQDERTFRNEERARADARAKAAAALKGNLYEQGEYTPANAPEVAELLEKSGVGGDPKQRAKIMQRLEKLATEGIEIEAAGPGGAKQKIKVPMPLSLVKQTLLGSQNTVFSWNEGYADNFEERIKKAMGQIDVEDGAPAASRTANDLLVFQQVLRNAAESQPRGGRK